MTAQGMPADGIRQYVVGPLQTNCYVVVSDGEGMVVDPGAAGDALARVIADEGIQVVQIVATHGHHDHVGGIAALQRATGAPFAISAADAARAQRALELSSHVFDVSAGDLEDAPAPDRTLGEGDLLKVGKMEFRVVEAPGHTEGGIVLLGEGVAFVGDTLFAGSCGRTDLAGGSFVTLMATLARLKEVIAPPTVLLCGHGPSTTMEQELASNPWLL